MLVLIYLAYLGLLFAITRRKKLKDPGFATEPKAPPRGWFHRIVTLDVTGIVLNGKTLKPGRAWFLLGVSTLIMSGGTWILVLGTDKFGMATNIPLIFVAVVLSAAATSVPDTILSMKDARKGNYDDAVSNALGSNIFDIAFALGFPILLYNLIHGESMELNQELLKFTKEVWVFLLLATFLTITIMLIGKRLNLLKAYMMLGIYLVFLFFVVTQVGDEISGIGKPIGDFLKNVADGIGDMLY